MTNRSSVFCFNLTNHFLTAPHEPPDAVLQFQAHAALTPPRTLHGSLFPFPAHSQGSILPPCWATMCFTIASPTTGSSQSPSSGLIHAVESFNTTLLMFRRDTDSGVLHGKECMPVLNACRHRHSSVLLLYRIALSQRL